MRALRNAAGWMVASTLSATGALRRAYSASKQENGTLALFFHDPPRRHFTRIVGWFRERGYRFISLEELEACLIGGTALPEGSVWLSFDDAWRRNLTDVIPVVQEWDLPITLFVPTEEVLRGTFWFSHALRNAAHLPEPFRTDPRQLWHVPDSTRRAVVDDLFQHVPVGEREVMSVDEIVHVSSLPQVTIASHTATHAILPTCTDEELLRELTESKSVLEQWTGRNVRALAYPNGDFDERAGALLAKAGYSLAFTTENHAVTPQYDRYYLPRCSIMDDGSLCENLCHAFGLWPPPALAERWERSWLRAKVRRSIDDSHFTPSQPNLLFRAESVAGLSEQAVETDSVASGEGT